METYGPHLLVRLEGASRSRLTDMNILYQVMEDLVEVIGMQSLTTPSIVNYIDPEDDSMSGISLFKMIKTSHISGHLYPNKNGQAFFDIFSCKQFDETLATTYLKSVFNPSKMDVEVIQRKWNDQ